ncbi:MAG TPA: hypothetical protein VKR56_11035 [Candidatus Cybelea sp.]|nr:hypothetical protein [Candidatus Cybelea sp.]
MKCIIRGARVGALTSHPSLWNEIGSAFFWPLEPAPLRNRIRGRDRVPIPVVLLERGRQFVVESKPARSQLSDPFPTAAQSKLGNEPELVRYVIDHSTADGMTLLKDCPSPVPSS